MCIWTKSHPILLLMTLTAAPGVTAQNGPRTIEKKPIETTVCAIMQNPAAFNNKLVRVRGFVSVTFELSTLAVEGCFDGIWFALGDGSGLPGLVATVNGKGMPGGKTSKGTATSPLRIKLVRDSNFEKFDHYMTVKSRAKPCLDDLTHPTPIDCGVDRVTATFTGRIDSVSKSVHEAHLKQSTNRTVDFKGFGHMGMYDAQL